MDRAQKAEAVSHLNGVFNTAGVVVVTHYSGLSVSELSSLRGDLREVGGTFRVIKNRLARFALEGTPVDSIKELFSGPTAIAFSDDPVAAPKAIAKFAKANDKLVILGGVMGATALDVAGVKVLAELPSLDEIRGKIAGLINAPATKIARVLQAPGGQIARVLSAYAAQGEAA